MEKSREIGMAIRGGGSPVRPGFLARFAFFAPLVFISQSGLYSSQLLADNSHVKRAVCQGFLLGPRKSSVQCVCVLELHKRQSEKNRQVTPSGLATGERNATTLIFLLTDHALQAGSQTHASLRRVWIVRYAACVATIHLCISVSGTSV